MFRLFKKSVLCLEGSIADAFEVDFLDNLRATDLALFVIVIPHPVAYFRKDTTFISREHLLWWSINVEHLISCFQLPPNAWFTLQASEEFKTFKGKVTGTS